MAVSLVSACDTITTTDPAPYNTQIHALPEQINPGAPKVEVSIWFMGANAENNDVQVVAAANTRLEELGIPVTIKPIWAGGWGMGDPAQLALDTADRSVDIFWTASWGLNYFNNARIGNFVRLDDPNNNLLASYGRDMLAEVDDALWTAFTADGPAGRGLYGVPGPKDSAAWFKMDVNNTRLAELGYNFDDIFTLTGSNHEIIFNPVFEEIMQASKDKWGADFFPLNLEQGNFVQHFSGTDGDLTGLDIFAFPYDPNDPSQPARPEVTLQVDSELFVRVLERVRHFWEMGFIDPRLAIPGEEAGVIIGNASREGEYIFSTGQYAYGHQAAMQEERGIDCIFVPLSRVPLVSTMSAAGSGFGISVYSQNQAAAMQFLNAWYTDNTLANIMTYGLEGKHWNCNSEGLIILNTAQREATPYQTWRNGMGNVFMLSPTDADGPDFIDGFRAYNEAGVATAFAGFVFDGEAVEIQMAAITGVVDEYRPSLTVGAMNPVTAIDAYRNALMAAGAGDVLAELNRQLADFFNR
jgi:putative aldouronate transport system substrate-binding protein